MIRSIGETAPFWAAFTSALREAWAGGTGALLPLGFFAGGAVLVPFSIGREGELLAALAPGLFWTLLALSTLVSMERLFQADLEDGALDLWVLDGSPLAGIVAAKTLAHWLVSGLPMALLVPVFAILFQWDPGAALGLAPIYCVGALAFYFWGAAGAALAAGVRRGGLLIALIVLPLYLPTAIFGSLAAVAGGWGQPEPLFLLAATLFALAAAPFAASAALRMSVS